jgi:ribosome-associated heat shock protein Hsp15
VTEEIEKLRVDKWFWQARFFKTRSLSVQTVRAGHVRINGQKVFKPATGLKLGDVLTFVQGSAVRVIKVVAFGTRRGPATAAQSLYEDLTTVQENKLQSPKFKRKGRPTKQDRRNIDLYRGRPLE